MNLYIYSNLSLNFSTTKFILWYTIGLKALYEQKWIGKIVILWINFEENIVIFGLILDLKKKKKLIQSFDIRERISKHNTL